jgi:hypothetical protein
MQTQRNLLLYVNKRSIGFNIISIAKVSWLIHYNPLSCYDNSLPLLLILHVGFDHTGLPLSCKQNIIYYK